VVRLRGRYDRHRRRSAGAPRRVNRLTRHPLLADLLLVGVLRVLGVASTHGTDRLISAALILPLIWRRRAPFAVFTVIAVVAFGQWLAGGDPCLQPRGVAPGVHR